MTLKASQCKLLNSMISAYDRTIAVLHGTAREMGFRAAIRQVEADLIRRALSTHAGNQTLAAESLGMDRTTLIARMKALRIISGPSQFPEAG